MSQLRIIFLIALFVAVTGAPAGAVEGAKVNREEPLQTPFLEKASQALVRKAKSEGSVSVIVTLDIPLVPNDHLSPTNDASQAARLLSAQLSVLSAAGILNTPPDDLFTAIPAIVTRVTSAQLAQLAADPRVRSITENHVQRVDTFAEGAQSATNEGLQPQANPSSVPWDLTLIGVPALWSMGIDGRGYAVAVIDTGVDTTHPMFAGQVVSQACYSTNDPNYDEGPLRSLCPGHVRSIFGTGTGVNCPSTIAGCDHGTHVAGIIAGRTASVNGAAPGAKIISIKVATRLSRKDCPAGCATVVEGDVGKALQRVLDLSYHGVGKPSNTIAAVNMSIGFENYPGACDGPIATLIQLLKLRGVASIVATGNESLVGRVDSPSCATGAIGVGASTRSDGIAPWSNEGDRTQLLAPGDCIYSSIPITGGGSTPDCIPGRFGKAYMSGTSQAAPHVAAAFALLRQRFPNASVNAIADALSCTGKLLWRADDPSFLRPRINVLAARNRLVALDRSSSPFQTRIWNFSSASEGYDWTPWERDQFEVVGGALIVQKWDHRSNTASAATPACGGDLDITAITKITGAYDESVGGPLSVLEYNFSATSLPNRVFGGYQVYYYFISGPTPPEDPDQDPNWPHIDVTLRRMSDGRTICESMHGFVLNRDRNNTLRVVLRAGLHKIYVNGQLACQAVDSGYQKGIVRIGPYWETPEGGTWAADYVSIQSGK